METLIQWVLDSQRAQSLVDYQHAAERVVTEIRPKLWIFVFGKYRASRNPSVSAEDLLQEILIAIVRGMDDFKGDSDAQFWAFCYRICRNKMVDQFRQKGIDLVEPLDPEQLLQLAGSQESPDHSVADQLHYAMQLVEKAKPPCRQILWAHYILDWDYKDIADSFGIQYDAVRMRIARCLELARKLVQQHA